MNYLKYMIMKHPVRGVICLSGVPKSILLNKASEQNYESYALHPHNYHGLKRKCYPADHDLATELRDSTIRRITTMICVCLTFFRPFVYDGPGYLRDRAQRTAHGGDYDCRFY